MITWDEHWWYSNTEKLIAALQWRPRGFAYVVRNCTFKPSSWGRRVASSRTSLVGMNPTLRMACEELWVGADQQLDDLSNDQNQSRLKNIHSGSHTSFWYMWAMFPFVFIQRYASYLLAFEFRFSDIKHSFLDRYHKGSEMESHFDRI